MESGQIVLMAAACILPASLRNRLRKPGEHGDGIRNATTYTLTVTGTATSSAGTALVHSVNVTLEVM